MDLERYQRQILLSEIGVSGQQKIQNASVLIIGAGGLGCPAIQYLAAAGVGTLGIVDFDIIEKSNLQRQVLYTTADIGKHKATVAAERIQALNPETKTLVYNQKLDNDNALQIIRDFDIVIDGSDNFATRYLVNDACVLLNKPLIYGAVLRFEGHVGVFNLQQSNPETGANYRDLFPIPPSPESSPSCNEVGVLGVLPGTIGILQATEALKIITGIGQVLANSIMTYDALSMKFTTFQLSAYDKSKSDIPKTEAEFKAYNYDWFCNSHNLISQITNKEFESFRLSNKASIIDVREPNEEPIITEFLNIKIPLSSFEKHLNDIPVNQPIILFCNSGTRSLTAANILLKNFPNTEIYSLQHGIIAYKNYLKLQDNV
jgi:molybdopterin/thiamine biosynthesis adenylyltransferase/rhodanese-related sulfurtransferase